MSSFAFLELGRILLKFFFSKVKTTELYQESLLNQILFIFSSIKTLLISAISFNLTTEFQSYLIRVSQSS
jgi:hypothetical protein